MRKEKQNSVSDYLDNLYSFQQLKHSDLVELFKTYENGRTLNDEGEILNLTPEAKKVRKKLIECNLRLVVSIAKQYKGHNVAIEDLIQEGNIGLMKAIERFKWNKGFKFSTYATWWIKQSIGQYLLKGKRMIRLPAHAATVQRKMCQAAEEFRETMGCDPTQDELRDIIGASETVVKATMHSGRAIISLNQPISSEDEGDCIGDKIEDDRPEADPFNNVAQKELLMIARTVLSNLSPKEAAILRLRFGLVEDDIDSSKFPITIEETNSIMSGKALT